MTVELEPSSGFISISILLSVLTPFVAHGFWEYYRLLGLYHPTPDHLDKHLDNHPEEERNEHICEHWFTKFVTVFFINTLSTGPVFMVFLSYGVVVLGTDMTYATLFGSGMIIIIVNSLLRLIDMIPFRWNNNRDQEIELLLFGYSFLTSLWVLTAIGTMVYEVNGQLLLRLQSIPNSGLVSLSKGIEWAVYFLMVLVGMPLIVELVLSRVLRSDSDTIDYESVIE